MYSVTTITPAGAVSINAMPFDTLDAAMGSLCREIRSGAAKDAKVTDSNGKVVADLAAILAYCARR